MRKIYNLKNQILALMLLFVFSLTAQTGDNCSDAITAIEGTNTAAGINTSSASTVSTTGTNALWYIYTPANSGSIDVSSCISGTDTEVAIHDLGSSYDCNNAGQSFSLNDDAGCGVGTTFASELLGIGVCGGNTYAIEWGDRWSPAGFDWDLTYTAGLAGCTNSAALNYNPCATTDDGSCIILDELSCEAGFFSNTLYSDQLENNTEGIIDGDLLFQSGLTASLATGPSGAIVGNSYLYYETSGTPQDPSTLTYNLDLACADTAQVSFFYHMYGADIGSLDVSFVPEDSIDPIIPLFMQAGQVQAGEDSAWILVQTGIPVGALGSLVFTFNYGGSFAGDIAIDGVEITACESCIKPLVTTTIIDSCEANGEFYVDIDLMDLQGTASFDLLNEDTVFLSGLNAAGVTRIGPFAGGTTLNLSLSSPTTCCVLDLGAISFDCLGCTNPLASNFDMNANLNDGTCLVPGYYCETATKLTGCDSIITNDTIYDNLAGVVATDFNASRWYVYCPPGDGYLSLNFNMPPDVNGLFFTNPESFVHDLGPGVWTETDADSVLCANVDSTGVATNGSSDPDVNGSTYSSITPVVGGNVYAIELGNSWTQYAFDWDWAFGCEPVANFDVDGSIIPVDSTTAIASVTYTNPLADPIQSCLTYSIVGSDNTDTLCEVVPGNQSSTLLFPEAGAPGLSPGVEYEFCVSYECLDGSGCFSIPVCETFVAAPSCHKPDVELTATCIANGFYTLNVAVTNDEAFNGNIELLGFNLSGFEVFETNDYNNSVATIINPNDVVNNIGVFQSGTPASIQLIGIDDPGCPSEILTIDLDCSCFGLEPVNDTCLGAINLSVDTVATCDGIVAPFTLECASVDENDPVPGCFAYDNTTNVWFSFQAPCGGNVSISTDYTGGALIDTEIALYSGNCNSLVEIACDADGGNVVQFNSIINASNLIAGDTYFILVDKWGETNIDTTFCIDVINTAISGCTIVGSANYDPLATCDDGSCIVCFEELELTGLLVSEVYEADDVIRVVNGQVGPQSSGAVVINAGRNTSDFTAAELNDAVLMEMISNTEYILLDTGFVAEVDTLCDPPTINCPGIYFEAENIQCNPDD